jgi:hypothetical protein
MQVRYDEPLSFRGVPLNLVLLVRISRATAFVHSTVDPNECQKIQYAQPRGLTDSLGSLPRLP